MFRIGKVDRFKKSYRWEEFDKLILTEADPNITYIVDGYVYISEPKRKSFVKANKIPLTNEQIKDFQNLADKHEELLMIVFLGEDHSIKASKYLDYVQSVTANP